MYRSPPRIFRGTFIYLEFWFYLCLYLEISRLTYELGVTMNAGVSRSKPLL